MKSLKNHFIKGCPLIIRNVGCSYLISMIKVKNPFNGICNQMKSLWIVNYFEIIVPLTH